MPSPCRHPESGQASADYVAVLAIVGAVLAGTGMAAAGGADVAGAVTRAARAALCVVGGDVCRPADARALGLEPCVVARDERERSTSMSFLLSVGRGRAVALERRSDGTAALVAGELGEGGVELSTRARVGRARAGVEVGGGVTWRRGSGWEFPDERALERFLQRHGPGEALADPDAARALGARAPDWRLESSGTLATLEAEAVAGGFRQPLARAGRRRVLGRRVFADGRVTWFLDASEDGLRLLGGLLPEVRAATDRAVVLEATTDRSGRLVDARYRTIAGGSRGDRVVEIVAPLDLRRPEAARAARELVAHARRGVLGTIRAEGLLRRTLDGGRVERRTYRQAEDAGGAALEVAGVGVDHRRSTVRRELVDAEVVARGRPPARRADCLALFAGEGGLHRRAPR